MNKLLAEINSRFRSGSNHAFLFHLNIDDLFLGDDNELKTLTETLLSSQPMSDSYFTLFFNLATGIRFINEDEEAKFLEFLKQLDSGEAAEFVKHRGELGYAIRLFSWLLKKSWKDRNVISALEKAVKLNGLLSDFKDKKKEENPLFCVIIEYLETIVHPQAACSSCAIDRQALVAHLMWAKDPAIRRANNVIALITDSLSSVASQLSSETGEIAICKVNFPGQSERERIYKFTKAGFEVICGDLEPAVFAKSSGGMSAKSITSLVRECALDKKPVSPALLFERKKKFIEERSGGLLEIQRPLYGMKAIGGLDKYKEYISNIVSNMKEGNWGAVPNGIMLLGAPGTGKTVFAEAVAFEAELPFVIMKNTRDMWVGSSERNLELCLSLIEAQAPVAVFVDEIDQQFQSRSGGPGDNTGTNQRMTARYFAFMSNTSLRGKVVWLAASNRPDLLDTALLREGRFDDRIPFFPPSASERADIVRALLYKNKVLAESQGASFEWDLTDDEISMFARQAHCHIEGTGRNVKVSKCVWEENHLLGLSNDDEEDNEAYFTGGQIENIIRRAREKASTEKKVLAGNHLLWALVEDFIPGEEMAAYDTLTELAVNYANSARIPAL